MSSFDTESNSFYNTSPLPRSLRSLLHDKGSLQEASHIPPLLSSKRNLFVYFVCQRRHENRPGSTHPLCINVMQPHCLHLWTVGSHAKQTESSEKSTDFEAPEKASRIPLRKPFVNQPTAWLYIRNQFRWRKEISRFIILVVNKTRINSEEVVQ